MITNSQRKHRANTAGIMFMIGASLGITVAAFAELAVATVMGIIAKDLGAYQYYPMAFGMAACGQLMATALAGVWCDARSPKYSLLTGAGIFLLGVLGCALAPNMAVLVAGRFLTGFGAGFMMVPMYVLVGSLVPKAMQPTAFAAFAGAWVLPSLVGPGLAGWVVEHISWRWIFGGVIILTIPVILIIVPLLGYVKNRYSKPSKRAKRTATAATCAGIGIVVAQFATLESAWWTWMAASAAVVLVIVSLRYLFPHGTLRLRPGLPSVIASRGLVNAAYMATVTNLPVILQNARGWSPKAAGIAVTVGSLTWALGAVAQSQIKDDKRRLALPYYGAVLIAAGTALTVFVAFQWMPEWLSIAGWGVAGMGIGFSSPALAVRGLAEVSPSRHGEISSDLQLSDAMGAAIAMGAMTAIFAALAQAPGALPYLPGPSLALLFALLATIAGYRLAHRN